MQRSLRLAKSHWAAVEKYQKIAGWFQKWRGTLGIGSQTIEEGKKYGIHQSDSNPLQRPGLSL